MLRIVISVWYCLIISSFFFHNSSHVVFSSSSSARCHPDESSALLQLNATFGRYNKSADCCTWSGVECDEATGHVVGLVTKNIAISEAAFKALARNLTHLRELWLDYIDMSSVPLSALMNLSSSLTSLSLRHCQLRGDLPGNLFHSFPKLEMIQIFIGSEIRISESAFREVATNLTRLRALTLGGIDMSSVPLSALMNLSSSLTSLELRACQLRGELPDNVFFHSFPKLESLDLSSNNLSGQLPDNVFFHSFPKLELLDLSYNNLSGQIPLSLLNISNVAFLYLQNNHFSGQLPSTPHNFSSNWKTRTLSLSDNLLNGPIPSWIYQLPYLELLDLRNNSFTGEIGNFKTPSLLSLDLSSNNLTGEIGNFQTPSLGSLDLSSNNLTGEIGNFQTPSLSRLRLQNNNLQGVIPRSLFQNVAISELDLSSNNLTGDVEFAELSKLKKLSSLDLSFNNVSILSSHNSINSSLENLSGLRMSSCHIVEFPHFLKFSKRLYGLDLSNNQIQGSVPTWFWESNKDSLQYLKLSNNFLTDIQPLPWKYLRFLDLRSNFFSCPLPILSPFLEVFLASKNNFTGEIPISICNLTALTMLDLSYNNFTGNIPRCIGNFSENLCVLDLRRNKLHGTIPAIFSTGIWLQSLSLNGNELEGALPRSLVNCSNLEVLDLGNNMLNDTFPDWLASLPELQVLVLRANRFHGSIGNPSPRFPFPTLRIMDLSHNEFVGALPAKYFDNFKAMQRDLENAKLGYMGVETFNHYYQESVVVTVKGQDIEFVKILTIFTTIDFSTNNFSGEIPESVGKLKSLKGLNLSHNMLTGILPSSLGNLSNLEWLDLSSNELVGKIPLELADITFLSFLNLSHNHLEGPIPVGNQFNTFGNESYMGNSGLCGFPLTKTCGEDPSPPSLEHDDGHDSSITNGFNWKIVMMGYASGFVIGISIGYMVLYSNGKLSWLSDTILEELQYRTRPRRPKRSRNARRS